MCIETHGGEIIELREPQSSVPDRVATFRDPEGNGFELRQHVGWRYLLSTRLLHIRDVPISTGLAKTLINPIKPELFAGNHEGRLGKPVRHHAVRRQPRHADSGAISSLRHWHEAEDEFVFVLSGKLHVDRRERRTRVGDRIVRGIPCR